MVTESSLTLSTSSTKNAAPAETFKGSSLPKSASNDSKVSRNSIKQTSHMLYLKFAGRYSFKPGGLGEGIDTRGRRREEDDIWSHRRGSRKTSRFIFKVENFEATRKKKDFFWGVGKKFDLFLPISGMVRST